MSKLITLTQKKLARKKKCIANPASKKEECLFLLGKNVAQHKVGTQIYCLATM
jgi:hypothetical protein